MLVKLKKKYGTLLCNSGPKSDKTMKISPKVALDDTMDVIANTKFQGSGYSGSRVISNTRIAGAYFLLLISLKISFLGVRLYSLGGHKFFALGGGPLLCPWHSPFFCPQTVLYTVFPQYLFILCTDYILASETGACSGGALSTGSFPITSEAECKKAAAQLAIVSSNYYGPDRTKTWNDRPGCSFDMRDKAYHWNPRPEAKGKWAGHSNYFQICSRVEIKDNSVPWTKPVPGAQYMGCIEDHRDRILKGAYKEFPKTNKGTV